MKSILNLTRMDILMLKPYAKNIALLIVVTFGLSATLAFNSIVGGIIGAYASIMATYPFSIVDKYHMDILYSTLPVNRKYVVIGRYLFSLILVVAFSAVSLSVSYAASFLRTEPAAVEDLFVGIATVLIVTTLMISIQMPLYFKMGYNKSKTLAYLPIIIVIGGVVGIAKLASLFDADMTFLYSLTPAAVFIGIGVIAVILIGVSLALSIRFYEKREF